MMSYKIRHGKLITILSNVILAIFWLIFVYINLKGFQETGKISLALGVVGESIIAILFLSRKNPVAVSTSPADWGIAFAGTFITTLLRPTALPGSFLSNAIITLGMALYLLSIASLNRSFGIVPAEREIKMGGLYRFIRHPMYLSHTIVLLGYVMANFSIINFIVAITAVVFFLIRVNREEILLSRNEIYRNYIKTTRWKLIPFVY